MEELPIDEKNLGRDVPLRRMARISKIMKKGTVAILAENERRAKIREQRKLKRDKINAVLLADEEEARLKGFVILDKAINKLLVDPSSKIRKLAKTNFKFE